MCDGSRAWYLRANVPHPSTIHHHHPPSSVGGQAIGTHEQHDVWSCLVALLLVSLDPSRIVLERSCGEWLHPTAGGWLRCLSAVW